MEHTQEEMFEYLDNIRESGGTNMYGATPYLEATFGLEEDKANEVLLEWMRTFEERHPR